MKFFITKIHLWLGLPLGILFFIVSFSGAIYTWEPEFSAIQYKQNVTPENRPIVSVPEIKKIMEKEFPEGDFRTVFFKDKAKAIEVLLFVPGTYYIAQVNPYSGELIHLQDMKKGWLNYLKGIHRNLLLGKVGEEIVHWTTLLFLIMMITGLVIWWPQTKASRKSRFTIKWNAKPKKLNYDLHNVFGFYATWIAIFSVITGLFWGFEMVRTGLQHITGENELTYDIPKSDETLKENGNNQFLLMDSLLKTFHKKFPDNYIRVSNPHKATDPINVTVASPEMLVHKIDHYFFDRYTGKEITGNFKNGLYKDASTFSTINGLVYAIHLGNIFSFPGRLLVFLASLIMSSLPITGFIIWWKKR
ncbi:PepSY-associated TM helix domain-containing protein [Flexithrix dorotheae]|uniref:PepSY-associated TM helix domain-containing protein n=1 Tax=Flexithrix dorotheae TaxID=70993 RepID=UPI0003736BFE|nr:PepSY-associated TM helix domain-containing protein [Flexithrix dorotheae]